MGENTDDMTTSTSKLRKEIKAMTGGFDIMKNENEFKSIYEIMDGLAEAVKGMEDIEKTALIEKIAGKNRANQVSALLNNWSQAEKALETSQNALGSAARENAAYIDSIEGRIAQLKASFEDLSNTIINSELIKNAVKWLNNIIKTLDKITEFTGVAPLAFLGTLSGFSFTSKINGRENPLSIDKIWSFLKLDTLQEKINKKNQDNPLDITPNVTMNGEEVGESVVSQVTEAIDLAQEHLDDISNDISNNSSTNDTSSDVENTQEQVSELVEQFNEVTESAEDAEDAGEQMAENMVESMSEASEETENTSENVEQLSDNNEKAEKTSSKLGTAMKSLLKSLAISAAIWVLSQAINAIINQVNALENEVKNLQDAVQDSIKEYQNAISEIETIDERLEEIKNRVDEINENNIELISEDELKQLEQETELLQLQKQNLEEIAKLKQQSAQTQIDKLLNDTDAFYLTENGLEAGYTGFKNKFIKGLNKRDDADTIKGEVLKGLTTEIPLLSDAAMAIVYAFTGDNANRKTQTEHIDNMLSKYDSLISINRSLSSSAMTNAEILKQYLNNQKEISEIEIALSQISTTLSEQLSTLPEDSEIYKQISDYISKITTSINDAYKTPESTAVQVYNNYANNYKGFEEGYSEFKKTYQNIKDNNDKIVNEGKTVTSDVKRAKAFSSLLKGSDGEYIQNLLKKNKVELTGGKLTAQTYEGLLNLLLDINTAKNEGLITDNKNLKTLTDITQTILGVEGDISTNLLVYVRYEQEQEMYDNFFNGIYNGINSYEVGADNYLLFKDGFISEMKAQGKDTELAESILVNMFPDFQTEEDRLKTAFSSVSAISSVQEELLAYARYHKFTADILEKYNLTQVFADMGISADEAGDYVLKLAKSLTEEAKAASKAKSQELNSEFLNSKTEFDEGFKNNITTYDDAIQGLETGEKSSLTYEEVSALIALDTNLADKFRKTTNGYIIDLEKLYLSRKKYQEENKQSYKEQLQNASVAKILAENNQKRIEQMLSTSTDLTEQRQLSEELNEQKDIIAGYDDLIAQIQIMYDQCSESVVSYTDVLETAIQKLESWKSLYEQAIKEINSIGQLTPETLLDLQNLAGDDWVNLVKKNEIGFTLDYDAYTDKMVSNIGLDKELKRYEDKKKEIENQLKDIATENEINIEFTGNFKEDYDKVFAELENKGNYAIAQSGIHTLDEEFDSTCSTVELLIELIEGLKDEIKEFASLTTFNENISGIDKELGLGIINNKQYNDKYANYVEQLRAEAEANGEITDPEVEAALSNAEITVHSNSQSQLQKELDKETKLIQEAYADRLIDADEYNRQMSALEDKYYGTSGSRGLLDDPDGTNLDTVAEQRKARVTEMYEGDLADADKLLEKGVLNNTQYAHEMRRIWEKYYKDKQGFAQESYEAEQKYLESIKSDVQIQIDGIQALIDKNGEKINAQIEGIEAENDEIEKRYDAEIAKIDEQIEKLEDKADEEDRFLEIKKAEAEFEKASQRTRKVFSSTGETIYRPDQNAIDEAQKKLNDLKREEEIDKLEKQKEELEKQKEAELELNNQRIADLNAQLAAINQPLEALVATMSANLAVEYGLDPTAITAILSTDVSKKGLEEYNEQAGLEGKNGYSIEAVTEAGYGAASKVNSETISQDKKNDQLKEAYTVIDSGKFEGRIGEKVESLLQLMMTSPVNDYVFDNEGQKNKWKPDVSDYDWGKVQNQQIVYNIGDIVITEPIGGSDALAHEIRLNFANAMLKQTYTNTKK